MSEIFLFFLKPHSPSSRISNVKSSMKTVVLIRWGKKLHSKYLGTDEHCAQNQKNITERSRCVFLLQKPRILCQDVINKIIKMIINLDKLRAEISQLVLSLSTAYILVQYSVSSSAWRNNIKLKTTYIKSLKYNKRKRRRERATEYLLKKLTRSIFFCRSL